MELDTRLQTALNKVAKYLLDNSKEIEPEIMRVVNERFWDLFDTKKENQ